jgi:hypothetical protein
MTVFESRTIINKPIDQVYLFLADMNNHQQLMPDTIQNWSSTTDEARFSIPNMGSIALKIENRSLYSQIRIIPAEKTPFALELNWNLATIGNTTTVILSITADLSMMMKMLASGPLQKLADHETQSLAKVFA